MSRNKKVNKDSASQRTAAFFKKHTKPTVPIHKKDLAIHLFGKGTKLNQRKAVNSIGHAREYFIRNGECGIASLGEGLFIRCTEEHPEHCLYEIDRTTRTSVSNAKRAILKGSNINVRVLSGAQRKLVEDYNKQWEAVFIMMEPRAKLISDALSKS